MKRFRNKWLLLALVLVFLVTAAGCGGGNQPKQGQGGQKFAGVTIRFLASNHPYPEAIKSLIPEFEKQTGIKVNMESYFEDQLTQKLTVELTSGSSTVDVFMTRPLQEGRLFSKNNWYQPLNSYINDANKTPASWNWGDFPKSTVDAVTFNNNINAIPLVTEWEMLFYRKDLFEQAGLKPPTTLEELEAAAKKLHNPSAEMYGIVSRGQRGAAVTQFSSYLYEYGGDFIKNGKAVIDSPEAVKALQYYGRILHDYGPPGVTNMSWPQAQALFASGKVAMWTDASTLLSGLLDPNKSKVADKVGLAPFPAGPAGFKPYNVVPWAVAISAQSKNKDAAWEFVKWLSSPEVMKKAQLAGNTTSRASIWNDQEVLAKLHPGLADIAKKTSPVAVPYDRPLMTAVGEARDAIGDVIVKAIETGGAGDIAAAAKEAAAKVDALLQKAGENK
ncbi:ABC transporter substrate-binding protein [Sporolituus thermophilus]|uniref:Multiple sugar transport system substrate-binding protein n=1 Tax=Sporolituus thermophilus DSM 23256 TaxID=1123285 RepID=A0A1G7HNU6_9FIRM|nr:sugar ABC transporter substrate-binding protein [Sporolituus thermophilus]SDF02142.1 multiple sugar transport system substrate-binding protein [Sporolituus thermophilus DSM 23256]